MIESGGCFGATSTVTVVHAGGERRATEARHVARGDAIEVEGGGTARVLCVVRTANAGRLVSIPGGPTLTPHHPVRVGGAWRAPEGLGPLVASGGTVYNFVLDSAHVAMVDGFACVTLGHDLADAGAAHAFYGTRRVVDALRALPGWADGAVAVASIVRDGAGAATGFVPAAAAAEPAAAAAATPAAAVHTPKVDLCAICFVEPAGYAAVPCGHQCACGPCIARVRAGASPRCPICRAAINDVVHVIAAGVVDDEDSDNVPVDEPAAGGGGGGPAAAEPEPEPPSAALAALAVTVVDDAPRERVAVTVAASGDEGEVDVVVRVAVPETAARTRAGVDIAVAIDVSGSMGTDATYEDEEGRVHTDGLSVLCIAQHAVRVVAASLTAGDRLAVIAFDNAASVALPLTAMNAAGRAAAEVAVSGLRVRGQTNIWAGLEAAMDALRGGVAAAGRQQSVLLLTDGQPNVVPRGGVAGEDPHVTAMRRYAVAHGGFACTVRTFGFGYDLDSELLLQLARAGRGTFAFVPVAPVMGTVFVHAIANALSSHAPSATAAIAPVGGARFALPAGAAPGTVVVLPGGVHATVEVWGLSAPIGPLQCGQTRELVVKMLRPAGGARFVDVSVDCGDGLRAAAHGGGAGDARDVALGALRAEVIERGFAAMHEADAGRGAAAHAIIAALAARIAASPAAGDERVVALRKDVTGRMFKSLDGDARYKRWGRHYLRALLRAHEVQQCTNVLDFGVQAYGGTLFAALRERGNALFLALPPPEIPRPECPLCHRQFSRETIEEHSSSCFGGPPPARSTAPARPGAAAAYGVYSAPAPPPPASPAVDMTRYTTDTGGGGGGCFGATSTVTVVHAGGERRATEVRHVARGDAIEVEGGGTARVLCVVRFANAGRLVSIPGGPTLTPHHPVRVGGAWRAPEGLGPLVASGGTVYNFVLDSAHVAMVDGFACVTLGHGLADAGAAHAFYGTRRVVDALRALPGWAAGAVAVEGVIADACGHATAFAAADVAQLA